MEEIRRCTAEQPNTAQRLQRELAKGERERDNLLAAIRIGGRKLEPLVAALVQCEQRLETLRRELAQLATPAMLDQINDKQLERELTDRAAQWREVLAGDVPLARQAIRTLMAGPIWLRPAQEGYVLRGATRLGALFDETSSTAMFKTALRWRPHGDCQPLYKD